MTQVLLADGRVGEAQVIANGELATPTRMGLIRQGFVNVAEAGSTHGVTWAHRGGSANWPEFSEQAYDNCLFADYGVLEFSARRTSDGVWFGLHDLTLARTSQNPALTTPVTSMTWAAVSAYKNTLNGEADYYKLDDFLAKYSGVAVVMVDNKGQDYNVSEYLPKLTEVGPKRVIVKLDGVNVLPRYVEAKAAGFDIAGYWYWNNYAANLPSREPYTNYIGMNITADQAIWNELAGYNKALWGHVAVTQSEYNTAMNKGASFVQTGNVAGVDAVNRWTTT